MANPIKIIPFAIFMLFFGPIVEELGWRGFALDHLEKHYNWVVSSIVLAFFWSLWHLPLFFIEGTYQYGLLQKSYFYIFSYMIGMFIPTSIIMDWLYNKNNKSILSGVLFHFSMNFYGELIDIPNSLKYTVSIFITFIFAGIILMTYKRNINSSVEKKI
ncbi:CPBP family intramembrane glutamic endopeptidase [Caldisalinibacter kiritimatiensis]|uniref:Abortive infection protein n=1 Tax=Caldisalinibacter kiritimatiensis TaxID=1304284 RepID=R1AU56_9FIRM|nr:CPBP family intramembrane glutamic endopeptidase [Caldisalinibacter kiritimatiensis]EOD00207.1 Abortive infection protein [Caldisalinibacter kiritimatiensis]